MKPAPELPPGNVPSAIIERAPSRPAAFDAPPPKAGTSPLSEPLPNASGRFDGSTFLSNAKDLPKIATPSLKPFEKNSPLATQAAEAAIHRSTVPAMEQITQPIAPDSPPSPTTEPAPVASNLEHPVTPVPETLVSAPEDPNQRIAVLEARVADLEARTPGGLAKRALGSLQKFMQEKTGEWQKFTDLNNSEIIQKTGNMVASIEASAKKAEGMIREGQALASMIKIENGTITLDPAKTREYLKNSGALSESPAHAETGKTETEAVSPEVKARPNPETPVEPTTEASEIISPFSSKEAIVEAAKTIEESPGSTEESLEEKVEKPETAETTAEAKAEKNLEKAPIDESKLTPGETLKLAQEELGKKETLAQITKLSDTLKKHGLSNKALSSFLTREFGPKIGEAMLMLHEDPNLKTFMKDIDQIAKDMGLKPEEVNAIYEEKLAQSKEPDAEASATESDSEEAQAETRAEARQSVEEIIAGRSGERSREQQEQQINLESTFESSNANPQWEAKVHADQYANLRSRYEGQQQLDSSNKAPYQEQNSEAEFRYRKTEGPKALEIAMDNQFKRLEISQLLSSAMAVESEDNLGEFEAFLSQRFGRENAIVNRRDSNGQLIKAWEPGLIVKTAITGPLNNPRVAVSFERPLTPPSADDLKRSNLSGDFNYQTA